MKECWNNGSDDVEGPEGAPDGLPIFHDSTAPTDSIKSVILYDDGDWSKGHYQSIFGLYVKACLANGWRVSAACPRPNIIRKQLGALADSCRFHQTTGRELKVKYRRLKPLIRLMWWARAARAVKKIHKTDGHNGPVFFMNTNHLRGALWTDRLSDRLMPSPWSTFSYDSAGRSATIPALQKQFHFLNAAQCRSFGVTDEKMTVPMQAAFPALRIVFLPDATPEECSEAAPHEPEILRRANGRKMVGLLGMLHKRKGLLTAIELAKSRPDLFFLFAGAYDLNKLSASEKTEVTSFFNQLPENCFCHLERITDEAEFNALVKLIDIVFAVYPGFTNSSGLLTKAGLFGKPCLVAAGDTCMADRVKKHNLGLCVAENDVSACSAAINRLLDNTHSYNESFSTDFNEEALHAALNQLTGSLTP